MKPRYSARHLATLVALALTLVSVLSCSFAVEPSNSTDTPAPTRTRSRSNELDVIQVASPAPQQALSVPEVADRVRPAVVQVTNQQEVSTQQFEQPVPETAGIGSGVIYDPSGLILTNDHVVAGADKLSVALPDGRTFDGRIIGTDPHTDLAVIKIQGDNLPVATLGSAGNLVVGQSVVAIGNALALAGGPTVTTGIISALNRAVQSPSTQGQGGGPGDRAQGGVFLFDLIQTDAPINPGNSGGPLVDLQAQVIGISTLIAATTESGVPVEGIGFAISIDTAKRIATQLVTTGQAVHPYLGIAYVPLNPGLAAYLSAQVDRGMYITNVVSGSPAAQASLQEDNIIVAADGQELQEESSLARIIDSKQPGDTLDLTVLRDSQRETVQVTLAQQPTSE